jgi:diguanylate cyclase (GGDEF)-like protein/PAS domain S-box-containing protein
MTILGYDGEEATHSQIDEWVARQHPGDVAQREKALESYFSGEAPLYICEFRTKSRDGSWIWILARGMLVSRTPDGNPLRMIGTHADITDRKYTEGRLEHLANTDSLTGVSNRRFFIDAVEYELLRSKRSGSPAALLMIDIDHFKQVNDKFGHAVGDTVIKHIVDLSFGCLRRTDHIGRLGGEEFAILLPETDSDGAGVFASRLREIIAATPTHTSENEITTTVSIGVALLTTNDTDANSILKRADMALYKAKERGRNCVEFADTELAKKHLSFGS